MKLFTISLALALLPGCNLLACRYSVRDTGFVDLGEEAYRLVLSGRDLGARSDLYRRIAAASLLDANITFTVREEKETSEPVLTLEGSKDRKLVLARGDAVPADAAGAMALLESVALSPVRAEIHDTALKAFAVVVLVEGTRGNDNARVRGSLEAAIQELSQLMLTMPKPVSTPPALIRIGLEQLARERVTLWGLGFDPEPSADPRVAIVFGRGRRIGSPLEGPLITQTAVQERLVIIGQDCECELDRAWMKGPLLPARWDSGRQVQAARLLGFDPENPLVRTEISRIVMRGPDEGQRKRLSGTLLTLCYSEVALEDLPAPAEETPDASAAPEASPVHTAKAAAGGKGKGLPIHGHSLAQVLWVVAAVAAVTVLGLAASWWRRIGREQG